MAPLHGSPQPSRATKARLLAAAASLAAAAAFIGGTSASSMASGAQPTAIRPASSPPPSTTYAIVKTFGVGDNPESVAINDADDTVYVTNYFSDTLTVFDGAAGTVSTTVPFTSGSRTYGVAVDQIDDTVYVTNRQTNELVALNPRNLDDSSVVNLPSGPTFGVAVDALDDSIFVAHGASVSVIQGSTISQTVGVGANTYLVAINEADDSAYVTRFTASSISVLSTRDLSANSVVGGFGSPVGVAVNQADDTVYVTNHVNNPGRLSVINGRDTDDSSVAAVGNAPWGVAVDQRDDTVYVASMTGGSVSIINGRDLDDSMTIAVAGQPHGIAVDGAGVNQGVVYVTSYAATYVSVIARVAPSLSPASGAAGDTVTVTVDAPQVAYDVDDSTIDSISIGGVTAADLTAGAGDTWTVTAPAGTGTVPVEVTFAGGLTASAGSFTYASPGPAPVFPPSAPREVAAEAGDRHADITWTAPASTGSFPITHYEAVATPGGSTCLVTAPTTGCTLTGLTNGTTYTVSVRALNGAGWGATATSGPVTPRPAPTRPGPVQDLTVVEVTAAGTIELTWQPPLDDGGSPITSYRVRYRQVGTEDYIRIRPSTPDTTITVTGLIPGQRYWVRVAARNDVGHGPGTRTQGRILIPTG